MAKNTSLSALKITPEVMNYVTFIINTAAPQKTLQRLTINERKQWFLKAFFNFLSFVAIQKNQLEIKSDFVILNSTSFFEKARPFMEQHSAIKLYLHRDKTGQNYSEYALSLSNKYKDQSGMYQHYKDLNEWLVNFGKSQKKALSKGSKRTALLRHRTIKVRGFLETAKTYII